MKRKNQDEEDVINMNGKKANNGLFTVDSEDEFDVMYKDYSDAEVSSMEEDIISDTEWEEVPLNEPKDKKVQEVIKDISVTLEKRSSDVRRKRNSEEAKKLFEFKKVCFGLHIILIPFMFMTLKQRIKWTKDERLNRRLRRSVPKLISRKFKNLKEINNSKRDGLLRTLLIGLVMWYRSNYKVNSNGFRQSFHRLQYLINLRETDSTTYNSILDNPHRFYGERPKINHIDPLEDVRIMAKKKLANRDILVVFFLIILINVIPGEKALRLCFALPLHVFNGSMKKVKDRIRENVGYVPNRFDSDLLEPNFWIELSFPKSDDLYIIDPLCHLKEQDIVSKVKMNEKVSSFKPMSTTQVFSYVIAIDINTNLIIDVSPRYLDNLCYRYFEVTETCPIYKSPNYKSYEWFVKVLNRFNFESQKSRNKETDSLRNLGLLNYTYPKTLKELQNSQNFIIPSLLKSTEIIDPDAKHVAKWKNNYTKSIELIYWKKDVILLKSRQHWNMLGRTVILDIKPLKWKKYIPIQQLRERKSSSQKYEIRELFSIKQTVETPKLPSFYCDHLGKKHKIEDVNYFKNKYGNIELYSPKIRPDGFEIFELRKNINTRKLIKYYNRKHTDRIKYLDIVSGFNFKEKRGYAVPIIKSILVSLADFNKIEKLINMDVEIKALQIWDTFLTKLQIKDRLDTAYGNHNIQE